MLKPIAILGSILALLTACGGSNAPSPSTSTDSMLSLSSSSISSTGILSSSSSNKSSSSSISSVNSSEPIDCSHLDPKKVYLLGTFQEGAAGLEALADPADPTNFCVGFDSYSVTGVISSSGEYIYAKNISSAQFYRFTSEKMTLNINGEWEYPINPSANDTLLFSNSCGVGSILLQPVTDEIYYLCPNDVINSQTTKNYYSLINDNLLGVMPDGSLLISSVFGLRLVDKSLRETNLILPENYGAGVIWVRARSFKDPITGHDSVWIANYDNSSSSTNARRFTLDLVSQKLTFDGEFAVTPSGMRNEYAHVLDGEGFLWQINTDSNFNDVIIKRPLNSSGKQATVIYNEADDVEGKQIGEYQFKKKLFVRIHSSSLVTGQ